MYILLRLVTGHVKKSRSIILELDIGDYLGTLFPKNRRGMKASNRRLILSAINKAVRLTSLSFRIQNHITSDGLCTDY